jgi:colicin import membrane protein
MGVFVRRDHDTGRMVAVSALAHVTLLIVVLFVLPLVKPSPLPIVAYTVELTDSSSLGGRLAPGRTDLPMGPRPGPAAATEAPAKEGEPMAKAEPPPAPAPEPPKPIERAKAPEPPKPEVPTVKLPSLEKPPPPKPEAKKPEPKPEPKPVEAKKPEPPKAEPKVEQKTPEPPKTAQSTANPNPAPKAADAKPAAEPKPAGKPGGKPEGTADGGDAYTAAADKWRAKGATGGGGGLGGTDTSPGPLGTPGYGGGGGGQVVGFEFLAYQQRVVTTVKSVWTNAAPRPGLVAKVRFQIAPDGEVSGIRVEQSSGDGVFDGSALRAVQRANPLPPPPARYVTEFRDFVIEFHSEEGGQASG